MENIINKILEDVDADIGKIMLADSSALRSDEKTPYKNWELLAHPTETILNWQLIRHENDKHR